MKIAIIGTGYVGLVSGACLSDLGHTVICVDTDAAKIDRINQGIMPIYEKDLEPLVINNIKAGRLQCTTSLKDAMKDAQVIMIAVGTPACPNSGQADLSYVYEASKQIAAHIKDYV
ncbi:MAG: 3-hydroxyacyl-CoA dehydrogenase NAD-binding domain-containing protein, partial [Alphaproteobacteria bacterium]|nr:3-hydroxyacyl-CoA dehydrogenase NAD-binding domain-containing protein [Alphaproteobacteria bacterium]